MELKILKYIDKLESDQQTFAEFLEDLKNELQIVALEINTEKDKIKAIYGDSDEEVDIKVEKGWPKAKESQAINLDGDTVVKLKKDWSKLLNDEAYHGEIASFIDKYKLTKVVINFQNNEVTFYSGKSHLVEEIDYFNQ